VTEMSKNGDEEKMVQAPEIPSVTIFSAQVNNDVLAFNVCISIKGLHSLLDRVARDVPDMFAAMRERALDDAGRSNVKQILLGAIQYAADQDGEFPERPSQLYPMYIGDIRIFQSPYTEDPIDIANLDAESDYVFVQDLKSGMPGDTIVVYGKEAIDDGMIIVGRLNGSVTMISDEVLNYRLDEQRKMQGQQR